MAAPQTPNAFTDFMNVLVLVGLPADPVNRALSRHAIDSSPDGVVVNVFNDVARLPRNRETLETRGKPDAVVDLRLAAAEADAALFVMSYRGRVPSMAHNAIDWLARRWRHGHYMTSRLPWSARRRVAVAASGRVKSRTPVELWDPE
jgi:NAD(P)H-dependent FMN reductase